VASATVFLSLDPLEFLIRSILDSYISTYVERDIRDVGELRDISAFIRFYNIIAPRSCGLLNKSDLASDANLSEPTINNYLTMLEMIYQISLLQPYSSNISKRFIKSQKLFMTDSGVYCHLLGICGAKELIKSQHKGDVIETFVYSELLKEASYSDNSVSLYHFRDLRKKEVDIVLENRNGKIIGIEVKAKASIKKNDLKGMKMRVPMQEVYVQTALAFGSNPQELPFIEVYHALQTGVVDGQDNAPSNIWDFKIYEVSNYLTINNYATGPDPFMVNLKWHESLPNEYL